ncbi:unnamed protein product [Arctia plantaginis]|uniref:Uncharacterized protein n=1 Tax=Arctia plantaginis TaxID=874455 RepID=A0A8S1AZC2_ARCPL|nr:unnamed protein product [Arctia plantaginis]
MSEIFNSVKVPSPISSLTDTPPSSPTAHDEASVKALSVSEEPTASKKAFQQTNSYRLEKIDMPITSPSKRPKLFDGYSPVLDQLWRDSEIAINEASVTLSPHSHSLFDGNLE